jgi:hypothetical protein
MRQMHMAELVEMCRPRSTRRSAIPASMLASPASPRWWAQSSPPPAAATPASPCSSLLPPTSPQQRRAPARPHRTRTTRLRPAVVIAFTAYDLRVLLRNWSSAPSTSTTPSPPSTCSTHVADWRQEKLGKSQLPTDRTANWASTG